MGYDKYAGDVRAHMLLHPCVPYTANTSYY